MEGIRSKFNAMNAQLKKTIRDECKQTAPVYEKCFFRRFFRSIR